MSTEMRIYTKFEVLFCTEIEVKRFNSSTHIHTHTHTPHTHTHTHTHTTHTLTHSLTHTQASGLLACMEIEVKPLHSSNTQPPTHPLTHRHLDYFPVWKLRSSRFTPAHTTTHNTHTHTLTHWRQDCLLV